MSACSGSMRDDIAQVLLDAEQIRARVRELAREITRDYAGRKLLLLAILKGAVVFLADLMRELDLPVSVSFIAASSYGQETTSSGEVKLQMSSPTQVSGYDVLIVEDIVDTGRTLQALKEALAAAGAASVKVCCLLDKPARREVDVAADYVGFEIPNHFVVGYGLDFAEKYRNLPYVAVLRPEVYSATDGS